MRNVLRGSIFSDGFGGEMVVRNGGSFFFFFGGIEVVSSDN